MIIQTITETAYFLPDDGEQAEKDFLALLANPGETYISAYNFSLPELFAEIEKADAAGVRFHILLDHVQSTGPSEAARLKQAATTMQYPDITITTAGGEGATSEIYHWKAIVVLATDGGEPWCWEGSVNMSTTGFRQGNSARLFRSRAWASAFIANHEKHRGWAWTHHPEWQICPNVALIAPPAVGAVHVGIGAAALVPSACPAEIAAAVSPAVSAP